MPKRERYNPCGWNHKKFDRHRHVVLHEHSNGESSVLNTRRYEQDLPPHKKRSLNIHLDEALESSDDNGVEAADLVAETDHHDDLETAANGLIDTDDDEDTAVHTDSSAEYPCGTKVKKLFYGSGWWSGKVTSYDGKRYHVTYEDGEIEKYTPKQMKNIVVSPDLEKIEIGCRVSVQWPYDGKYYKATVTQERNKRQPYLVEYDNEDGCEWIDFRHRKFRIITSKGGLDHVDSSSKMNGRQGKGALPRKRYAIGTQVKEFFEGYGWFKGEVLSHHGNRYRVIYEDDEIIEYDEQELSIVVDLAKVEVGSRLSVHWPADDTYYEATVTQEQDRREEFCVVYKHGGESEWVNFHERKFRLLEGRTRRRKVDVLEDDSDSDTDGIWEDDSDTDDDSEDEQ